jgi:CHAT domain-containing protein
MGPVTAFAWRWVTAPLRCFPLLCAAMAGCSSPQFEETLLSVNGELSGKTTRSFPVVVSRSGTLLIHVRQGGLDIHVTASDPAGRALGSFESGTGRYGQEIVAIEAPRSGQFLITLGSDKRSELSGTFRAEVLLRAAVSRAEIAYSTASRTGSLLSSTERAVMFKDAAVRFGADEKWYESGLALLAAAEAIYRNESRPDQVVLLAAEAAQSFVRSGDALLQAAALTMGASAGVDNAASEERQSAVLAQLHHARDLYLTHGAGAGATETAIYEGLLHYISGRNAEAAEAWETARGQCVSLRERICEARALQNLAVLDRASGSYRDSFSKLYQALALFERSDDPTLFADINDNLAFTFRSLNAFDEALRRHTIALDAYMEKSRCTNVSRSLYGMAFSLLSMGEVEQALEYYTLLLTDPCGASRRGHVATVKANGERGVRQPIGEICRGVRASDAADFDQRANLLWTAWDLGNISRSAGDPQSAIACHELAEKLATTDKYRLGVQLEQVEDHLGAGDHVFARALLVRHMPAAVAQAETNKGQRGYQGRALLLAGRIDMAAGELGPAMRNLNAALQTYVEIEDAEGEFAALTEMGEAAAEAGRAEAEGYFERADRVLQRIRTSSVDPTYRATLFSTRRHLYANWIRSIQTTASDTTAAAEAQAFKTLVISERSRAKLLSELVNSYSGGVAVNEAQPLRLDFSVSDVTRNVLAAAQNYSTAREQIQRALQEIGSVGAEGTSSAAVVAKAHTNPSPDPNAVTISLAEFRRNQPDSQTLIEYLLGDDASYAWIVRNDGIATIRLAPRSIINQAVTQAMTLLASSGDSESMQARLAELYELILRPLETHLQGTQLSIAADDSLYQLPFAALWDRQSGRYLIEKYAISYVPSIQFAHARMNEAREQQPEKVLLVGDPVYERSDYQARCAADAPVPSTTLKRDSATGPRRLIGAQAEMERIAGLFRQSRADVKELAACAATRDRVLEEELSGYSYIHFAAHAAANSVAPQDSAIYLAAYDEHGAPAESRLTVADLLQKRLSAQLVVLSGCSTGDGRPSSGDGVLGFSFAVLAAGGRQVVTAMWPVADAPMADAMQVLYERLLEDGSSPAMALRAAQLSLLGDRRWNAPRYWASFMLTGG